ncbi:exonuclease domain-containing protein [Moheibacter sediminis]|uniref:DNA polymerase-3 subunit epsilon n=1 Tax=Moheibacter sediminis TaxID=1434700 RepID=A0A1W1Y6P6_9FLAO|nr:exonuclease domain-containing protein [Moheibacter sediminis]SMC31805.1 DNA polymerase-3 subunit epsilon [Moheibacter sediminis]
MYAVIDVEATGGKKGEESIIEVAIFLYDGEKVIDQLISLVQPDREIDLYVQKLTQITPKMVSTAPKFHELAKRIIEITDGAIIVGHNVDFDYRMLKQEFSKLGYTYYRETIDTLPLSEKHFPDAESYSLGKLSKSLGIPVSDRHRASGDARATLELFKLLQDKDSEKDIVLKETFTDKKKSIKYDSLLKDLPNETGIFYVFNKNKQIIYLSRSKNISQSARILLTGKSNLSNKIKISATEITYETTGNELVAWLKENHEIKTLKPSLNENQKKINFPFTIYNGFKNGFKQLRIDHTDYNSKQSHILRMNSYNNALSFLSLISEEYELCSKINDIYQGDGPCLGYSVGECHGACIGKESPDDYNKRVEAFQSKVCLEGKSILIIGKGRTLAEKSFVWIKNNVCKGYGYFDLNHQIKTEKLVQKRMIPIEENDDMDSMARGFLFSEKYLEIINLNT